METSNLYSNDNSRKLVKNWKFVELKFSMLGYVWTDFCIFRYVNFGDPKRKDDLFVVNVKCLEGLQS